MRPCRLASLTGEGGQKRRCRTPREASFGMPWFCPAHPPWFEVGVDWVVARGHEGRPTLVSGSRGKHKAGPGTTTQHALDALRRAIAAGMACGVARKIAEGLDISIAPVREALRALEQEGQVMYRPWRG